jgi:hypothetical protein
LLTLQAADDSYGDDYSAEKAEEDEEMEAEAADAFTSMRGAGLAAAGRAWTSKGPTTAEEE